LPEELFQFVATPLSRQMTSPSDKPTK